MKKIELMNMMIQNGYRVFESSNDRTGERYDWLHVLSPSGAILYIQPEKYGGYHVTYEYVPSRETGTGCSCNDDPQDINSIEELQKLEQAGTEFARRLRVKEYWKSWDQFAAKNWATLTEYKGSEAATHENI
jgi:hypothetical protein